METVWLRFHQGFIGISNQSDIDLNGVVVFLHGDSFIIAVESVFGHSVDNVGIDTIKVVAQMDVAAQIRITR